MSHYDYDLFVIGAGSGGVRGARMAAQAGARVAIAEEHRVGGTCVIRGCVPKKLFVYASHFHSDLEDMRGYGWTVDGATFDWRTLRENKDNEIDRLNGLYLKNLVGAGVELFEERATLEDAHTVRLQKSDKTVTAETILIATGGRPFVPDIPGAELGITSDDAFYLDELPKTIAIIGGGYIAVEFAGIFKGLGVEPTIHYRGPQILRGFDQDMRDGLDTALANRGIHVIPQSEPSRLTGENGRITMETRNGNTVQTDMVMFATGREAHTKGLGLESAGVTTAPSGAITVDEYSRTSADNIYAIGDVTERVPLTPVAIAEAMAFVETVYKQNPTPVDHHMIPTAVFSEPEIATVGQTEAEARTSHASIDIYKSRFRPMKNTIAKRDEQSVMKLIVDGASDRVLGVHVLGPDAAEMIQMTAIAMRLGATKADFDATMALHPSAAEELVTMREKWQPAEAEAAE